MTLLESMAEKAREWADEKVPYRHRGMTRRGCDCSGLLIGIMRELGYLKDFILPPYSIDWNLHGFEYKKTHLTSYIAKYANKIPIKDKQPGDVLLFKYVGVVCHTGIYVGNDLFVHSYLFKHTWYGKLKNSPWGHRLVEAWRIDKRRIL